MSKEKILNIVEGGKKESEMAKALRELREGMKDQIEFIVFTAPLHKAKYDSLIKEGFTEKQALELAKDLTGGYF